jgi:hypothetical protein
MTHNVIPAQAGIQGCSAEGFVAVALDPRLRGDDVAAEDAKVRISCCIHSMSCLIWRLAVRPD